jgi:hypothetical protein
VSEHRIAHPAQQDSSGDGARGQVYLYPHPLTLARNHAEAERIRLADLLRLQHAGGESLGDTESDRSSTCVLRPEDY